MQPIIESDAQLVEKSRRILAAQGKMRLAMLVYAAVFLGLCGYFTFIGIRKIDALDSEQLKGGFIYGLALAVVWTSFGVMGGVCLGKFVAGFRGDLRFHGLLIRYHDRLRDLGQLPAERTGEPGASPNAAPPHR
jgi:hypothetical protein